MIVIISLVFGWLVRKWHSSLWFILPLAVLIDLWRNDVLGVTGFKILGILTALWYISSPNAENHRLKI